MPHFGDMRLCMSCDGMGTQGVVTAAFSFSVPLAEHPAYYNSIPGNAEVELRRLNSDGSAAESRKYYVSEKSADDTKVTVKCLDRMCFTEKEFPCTDADFDNADSSTAADSTAADVNNSVTKKEKGMAAAEVLRRISEECGLESVLFDGGTLQAIELIEMPASMLQGKSCRDVLTELSKVLCGYFVYDGYSEVCYFCGLGKEFESGKYAYCDKHEKLRFTTRVDIDSVYMLDSSGDVCGGVGGFGFNIIEIQSALATPEIYELISGRVNGLDYRAYNCDTALFGSIPRLPLSVSFGGETDSFFANSFDIKLSSEGICGSVSRNTVSESAFKFKPKKQRELDKKYSEGDRWKNVQITKKSGLKYVYVNENKEKQKFGFDVKDGGMTSYEGVMSSKKEAVSVKVDKKAGKVTVNFSDGHAYTYSASVTKTDDGYDINDETEEWA